MSQRTNACGRCVVVAGNAHVLGQRRAQNCMIGEGVPKPSVVAGSWFGAIHEWETPSRLPCYPMGWQPTER